VVYFRGTSGFSAECKASGWVSDPTQLAKLMARIRFYPTPFEAVRPLIPHLRGVRTFAEPCCGDGALVRHLESFRLRCVYRGDIATGQDALVRTATATPTRSSPIRPTPVS
jgi:hypothetical protein